MLKVTKKDFINKLRELALSIKSRQIDDPKTRKYYELFIKEHWQNGIICENNLKTKK